MPRAHNTDGKFCATQNISINLLATGQPPGVSASDTVDISGKIEVKQWNGWGDDQNDLDLELKPSALGYLQKIIGPSTPLPDATLEQAMSKVPAIPPAAP